ncbi:hypothetical protein KFL_000190120 [Klebsormidium nitens]|uniref:PCI domain-containing protein n=1 Tax=Klebsormidium nitens TaxID=105231 RepID=A0A1Y1HLE4_KLENI|nr:hypothetical protein KFL_000190120 [Klebsormidium nitens]|eukprot:GAQ78793.1 hypothetical protein KFL_000190120 [Klebsormidium nitens]
MSWKLRDYLEQVRDAIEYKEGATLASLLSITSADNRQRIAQAFRANPRLNVNSEVSFLAPPWNDILANLVKAAQAYDNNHFAEAYGCLVTTFLGFLHDFRNSETPWNMRAVHMLSKDMKILAEKADQELGLEGSEEGKQYDVGRRLNGAFPAFGSKVKRPGMLFIVNLLFRIYFRLNTIKLCRNLINVIEPRAPAVGTDFSTFPAGERVTYCFYTGRLAVFDDDFVRANQQLSFAFEHCHRNHARNQRRILKYLIPVKLTLGSLPNLDLVRRHNLTEYEDFVVAVRTGNIQLFERALETNEVRFLKSGVYLTLERLRAYVYRTLIKRIASIQAQRQPDTWHQMKLSLIRTALKSLGDEMDDDEVECLLANLIYRGAIKGYLHHRNKIMVLGKTGAFPKLSTLSPS